MITHAFAYLFPFLLVTAAIQEILNRLANRFGNRCNHPEKPEVTGIPYQLQPWRIACGALAAIVSVVLIQVEIKAIPLAGWLLGVNANFSIPLTMLLFGRVWQNATGIEFLDRQALRATWIFGLVAGLVLYPASLGLWAGNGTTGFDPYALGYGSAGLSLLLLYLTIGLLLGKNRFGTVLAASILAYNLQLLESPNLWDYFIDPLLAILSITALAGGLLRRIIHRLAG
jgi:hypothetical protein